MRIFCLFIIVLLNEISYQMVIPLMEPLIKLTAPHANMFLFNTLYGTGIAAFTIAVMLGSPLIGYLSDKFGRKSILSFSMLLMVLSSGLYLLSLAYQNVICFLLARLLSGFSGASTAVVQAMITDISVHRSRAINFSVIGLALTIGLILGPVCGGFFISGQAIFQHMTFNQNLSLPFLIAGLITLFNLILFISMFKNTQVPKIQQVNHSINLKPIILMLSIFFILEFSWSLYYLSLPLFLSHFFLYSPRMIGFYLSAMGICMCGGLIAYRWISQYLSNHNLIKLFFIGFMLSVMFLCLVKNSYLYWTIILPITFSVAISYVAIMELISESVDDSHQGALMGISLTTMALAWTITGFFVGFLFNMNNFLPFIISMVGLVIGLFFLFLHQHRKAMQ